jgi:hypothetical protein
MHTKRLTFIVLALCALAGAPPAPAQAPGIITYQGRVTNNGAAFTGNGQFRFVIYRAGPPPTTDWSHDNSSVGAAMPATAVVLPVSNGLFSVGIGDTSVPGVQTPIPASIFANSGLRIRIWFSDGVVESAVVADHAITSTGYSMLAMTVPDSSITAAKLANGSVSSAKIAAGAVGSTQLADDITLANLHLAGTGFGNGTETVTLDAATGAGQGALFTLRNGGGTPTWSLDSDTTLRGSHMQFFDAFGQRTMSFESHSGAGSGGALVEVANHLGQTRLTLDGDGAAGGGQITLQDEDGTTSVNLRGAKAADGGGRLDLSSHLGVLTATLDGDVNFGGVLALRDGQNYETVYLSAAPSFGEGAYLSLRNGFNMPTLILDADASGDAASLSLYNAAGNLTVLVDGDEGTGVGGVIQVRDQSGSVRAELDGQNASGGGELVLDAANGTTTVNLRGADSASTGAQLQMYQADGQRTVNLDAQGSTGGGVMELFKSNGVRTIYIDADNGGEGRISTQVLEITGGSDFSENFDIRENRVLPGMLVRIDAGRPGELAVADCAYDRAVAGVVSGAGGVKPGLMMGQRGSLADGQHPVALTGRVYCLVDADLGAIEPGDLITTSDTPGHGMKVTDHTRAQGAIVGKAMTPLASGRGLVLVLVSLQ